MGLFSRRNDTAYDDTYNSNGGHYGNSHLGGSGTTNQGMGNNGPMTQNGNIVNGGTSHHGLRHSDQNVGMSSNIVNDGTTGHHGLGHNNQGLGQDNTYGNTSGTTNHGIGYNDQAIGRNSQFGNDGTTSHTIGRNDGYDEGYNNGKTRHNRKAGGGGSFLGGMMGHKQRDGTRRGRNTARGDNHMSHREKKREKRALFDIDSGYYNRRPSFGQWLKFTWIDLLTFVIMGAIGLGVYEAHPAPTRSFPLTFRNGDVVYPEFAYPLRHNIIPIWAAALLATLIPIFIILCMQIRIRSFWDTNNAIIGLFYSVIGAAVFQVFVKWLIGGLRPHFLSVCDPDPNLVGKGFEALMFDRSVCRGNRDDIDDSLESMPSGHSTAAFAGFLFLYFYLNAKLKVFSNHHPAFWKLIAVYAPVLAACLIAGSLTIDEFHNWYDCLAGAVIGSVFAISAYRMVYASVWDFRFNHIPLTRHTPFSYGAGAAGAGGFESAVFTRKAGWGFEEAYGGAPFDAAHGLRGQAVGFNQGAPGRHGGAGIMGNKIDDDVERDAGHHQNRQTHGHGRRGNDATTGELVSNGLGHRDHNVNDYDTNTGEHASNQQNSNSGTGGGIMSQLTGHRNHNSNIDSNTTPPVNTNTNTRNTGVTTNRDSNVYANEPTTPTQTSDGRYHHHIERKQVPQAPASSMENQGPGVREGQH
jgi:diacylglycerol diphosphate phosphatase/phosphatidate phosphatase